METTPRCERGEDQNESSTVQMIRANKASAEDVLRVAAYCRVSTDSEDQVNSFIAQMHYYYSFIQQAESMTFVDIYADEGITGTYLAKRDDKEGKIDRIYVKSVSRFVRNALDCLENIRILQEYGVSVFFENDSIYTRALNSKLALYINKQMQNGAYACRFMQYQEIKHCLNINLARMLLRICRQKRMTQR